MIPDMGLSLRSVLASLLICVPVALCVTTEDVIGCMKSSRSYRCCNVMRTDTLSNLNLTYDCSSPDNVTIVQPLDRNRTSPFRLFHSSRCISSFPQNICDYPNLVSVSFKWSSLKSIPSLSCLSNLVALDLSHNKIETLKKDTFLGLSRLRVINLQYNWISYIEPHTFNGDLHGLMIVILNGNRLTTAEAWPMSIKHHFCYFGLKSNKLERFSNEENWNVDLSDTYGPGYVDYSNNQFTTWVTEQLKMYGFNDLRTLGKLIEWGFDFRNNPWKCDCKMHEFLKLASNLPKVIWRDYFEVYCQSPPNLRGIKVIDLPLTSIVCNITENCPEGCFCQDQPERENMLVDCRGGGLTRLPMGLPDGKLSLLLSNNSITLLDPRPFLGRTRHIDVSRNGLEYISSEAVSLLQRNVETFNLSGNKLKYLPEIIQNIPFDRLVFENNSFVCDCNSTWMFRWLKQQKKDVSGIKCSVLNGDSIEAVQADDNFLRCHVGNPFPRVLSILLGILAFLFIATAILLVVFRYEALIIMHTNLKRLQKPREGNLDHDVFVSVEEETETDRVWAVKTLLPELEQKHNLKVYFALRDMDPGTVIVDETIKALKRSHTALIILSSNYLENPSKVFEFSEAYKIMVRQRQGRLIIVRSPEVTASRQTYVNAFIRLKKCVDREDVNLFEKIVTDIESEKSQPKHKTTRSVSQVKVMTAEG